MADTGFGAAYSFPTGGNNGGGAAGAFGANQQLQQALAPGQNYASQQGLLNSQAAQQALAAKQAFGYNTSLAGQQIAGQQSLQQGQIAGQQALSAQQIQAQQQQQAASQQQQGNLQNAQIAAQNTQLGQTLAGQQSVANTAAQASMFPAQVKQQEFNQVFPMIQGTFGTLNGLANSGALTNGATPSGNSGSTAFGPGTAISALQGVAQPPAGQGTNNAMSAGYGNTAQSPDVTVGGVLNNQQINQQVNAMRAQNDASAANQTRTQASNLAGRGFGANSPLQQLLASGNQMNALQANTSGEQNLRLNAAQQNAAQVLATQTERQNAYQAAQQAGLTARGQTLGTTNALLSALAGLA